MPVLNSMFRWPVVSVVLPKKSSVNLPLVELIIFYYFYAVASWGNNILFLVLFSMLSSGEDGYGDLNLGGELKALMFPMRGLFNAFVLLR